MLPETTQTRIPHVPVMLAEVLAALAPANNEIYVDGTFGAGGYTRAILEAANCNVIAIDRDPGAISGGQELVAAFPGRLTLVQSSFSAMKDVLQQHGIERVHGVVLDVGVSSMQIDEAQRGFSFMRDGPLDMRMSQHGPSAADYVNTMEADDLSRLIFIFGDEPKARSIARSIVKARESEPLLTTLDLVKAVEGATGPQRAKDRIHPATRTFQALRIFVNSELDELALALTAAEELLEVGGRLVVVTFHSLEDRIVKRFFTSRGGKLPSPSRHQLGPAVETAASFALPFKGHMEATPHEASLNPRARSAKMRAGIRMAAETWPVDHEALGVPSLAKRRRS